MSCGQSLWGLGVALIPLLMIGAFFAGAIFQQHVERNRKKP